MKNRQSVCCTIVLASILILCGLLYREVNKSSQLAYERDVYQTVATHLANKQRLEIYSGKFVKIDHPDTQQLDPRGDGLAYDERSKAIVVAPLNYCSKEFKPRCMQRNETWYHDFNLPRVVMASGVLQIQSDE